MVDRCMINSRGQSLAINTVIITALALVVLIILAVFLFRGANEGDKGVDEFTCKNIKCVECNQYDQDSPEYQQCYQKCSEEKCKDE